MDSYDTLVIILAVALSISVIIWIFVGILLVQLLRKVKEASATAKSAVENVQEFTSQLKNVGRVSAIGSVVNQVAKAFKGRK